MSSQFPKPPKRKQGRPADNSYLKYSGMAFQMAAAILLGVFLGRYLDGCWHTDPFLTVGCTLLGVFAGMYLALKDFL